MAKDSNSKEPVKPQPQLVEHVALKPIDNLAFEGGGVKGLVYVGALKELDKKGVLRGVKRVGGSSAGGITAMFVGLGYAVSDITKEMSDMDFTKFQDAGKEFWRRIPKELGQAKVKVVEDVLTVIKNKKHGLYKGDAFLKWAKAKVAQKLGNPNATFADLRKAMNADREGKLGLKDMMFTASNLSGEGASLQIFDGDHTPNVSIADAIRATMSYPGAFEAYEIEINGIKSTFVDGGLINNFPTDHYDDARYLPEGEHLNAVGINERTLGLRVDREDEIAKYKWVGREQQGRDVSSVGGYLKGAKEALLSDREKVRKGGFGIIQINDCNISTLNFELKPEEKAALIKSGVDCTSEYFNLYREGAFREKKVYRNLRTLYEGKSESELKAIKEALLKEIDDLTAKKEEVLKKKGTGKDSAKYEKISQEIQDSMYAAVSKLIISDEVMKKYELRENEDVEFIFKRFQDLIRLQLKQVEQSAKLLDSHLSELRALEKKIKDKIEENKDRIALFQKVKKDPEMNGYLKKTFDSVRKLYDDQMDKIIKIQKQKSEFTKLQDAAKKSPLSLDNLIRLKRLGKELYEAEHNLSEFFIKEQERIRNGLKIFLSQKVQDNKLSKSEGVILSNIIADEIIKVHSNEKPLTYEDYESQLLEAQKGLEDNLKKADLNQVYQNYGKMIETHRSTLKTIQENRAVMGENPSKMLEVSFKLSSLMKSQESIGPAIGRAILFLVGNVFSLAYLGVRAAIKQWGSPETYKKRIEDFEDKFKTNKEIFVERADLLRMEIEKKQVEFSNMNAPTKHFEEYMKLLQEAMNLATRLPAENRQEYQAFVEAEKARAEKEKKRIGREVRFGGMMEREKQKADQDRKAASDQSRDDKPKISPLRPRPPGNSKH